VLAKLLSELNHPEMIARLEYEYNISFSVEMTLIQDLQSMGSQEWLDADGDLGVSDFKDKSIDELRRLLGLQSERDQPAFPMFNEFVADAGLERDPHLNDDVLRTKTDEELREFSMIRTRPRWHQYVGLVAMVKRFFDGQNVILADDVGVGKTLQCMMVMAYLRHLKVMKAEKPPVGE
jgi:SNF2 family DNA or RNA helicase